MADYISGDVATSVELVEASDLNNMID